MVQYVVKNGFFTFRLEYLLTDSRFKGAYILGTIQSLTEERRELLINSVDFFSPFVKFLPMHCMVQAVIGHHDSGG